VFAMRERTEAHCFLRAARAGSEDARRVVIWEGIVAQTQVYCDMQGLLYRRIGWPPMYLVGPMLARIGRLKELWLGQGLPG